MLIDARYSVYRRKDGLPVFVLGTRIQCARAMGIKPASFDSYASRDRHNKPKRIRKWIIIREKDAGSEQIQDDISKNAEY